MKTPALGKLRKARTLLLQSINDLNDGPQADIEVVQSLISNQLLLVSGKVEVLIDLIDELEESSVPEASTISPV